LNVQNDLNSAMLFIRHLNLYNKLQNYLDYNSKELKSLLTYYLCILAKDKIDLAKFLIIFFVSEYRFNFIYSALYSY